MAAWRASSLSGPEVEVLTRAWREEAADEAALADLLPHQRPEDVTAAIARLRKDGLVERDRLSVTSAGASARQAIEDETDRLFFTPWPDEVGARSAWISRGNAKHRLWVWRSLRTGAAVTWTSACGWRPFSC